MAEYILKQAVLDALRTEGITRNMKIYKRVQDIQATEMAQVRHGRWIINSDGYYPYCSECKKEPDAGSMTEYCPNCGAKMDGEEETKDEQKP